VNNSKIKWIAILAIAAAVSNAALAQQSGQAAGQTAVTGLEEIIVTAQKREQAVQDIPASITAFSGEELARRGVDDIKSLANQVPNLQFGQQTGATFVILRGVGTSVDTGVSEPSVALYSDGVYLSRSTMAHTVQTDLSRVEVVRGPQGTLYGRNATGGAINFISKAPSTDFGVGGRVGFSNFNGVSADAYLTGAVGSDGAAFRISGGQERRDGFVKNIFNGQRLDELNLGHVRGALHVPFGDRVTADLSLAYEKDKGANAFQVLFNPASNPVGALQTTEPYKIASDVRTDMVISTLIANATIDWKATDDVGVRFITGYVDHSLTETFDADSTNLPFISLPGYKRPAKAFSQEVDISGKGHNLDWLVGLYYFHEDFHPDLTAAFDMGIPPSVPPFVIEYDSKETTKSYAAFGEATYHVTDKFSLVGGLRFNSEDKTFIQQQGTVTTKDSSRKWLPKISVNYAFTPNVLSYAQYQQGYKSGGVDLFTPGSLYKPENLKAYEVGLKTTMAGGAVTLNSAAFYYKYDNYQVIKYLGNGGSVTENADAEVKGLEAELVARQGNWRFNLAGTLLDAKYTKFVTSLVTAPGSAPQDAKGHYLNRAPKDTLSGGVEYAMATGSNVFPTIIPRAEIYYSATLYFDPYNIDLMKQDPFTYLNASIAFEGPNNNYQVRLWGRNLGDKYVRQFVLYTPTQAAAVGSLAAPRTFGVEFSYRLGKH
jgi:iron complex outermembrane receptor protein